MKKFICIILIAITSFGGVYAAPFQQQKIKHSAVKTKKAWKAQKAYNHKIQKKRFKKMAKHLIKKGK